MISKSLVEAYISTTYVTTEKPIFNIRIGLYHPDLDAFLSKDHLNSWAFITAENPFSKQMSSLDNLKNNLALESDLQAMNIHALKGLGIPDNEQWQPENSFLCPGISKEAAIELAQKYQQNAIVFGSIDQKAELIISQ